jgi:hypothetical protein
VIWFLEKGTELLICEIRRAADADAYEFEVAGAAGPRTERYVSPADLITGYLRQQTRLRAQGWRPRAGDVALLG